MNTKRRIGPGGICHAANGITAFRIGCSIGLLHGTVGSVSFTVLYLLAGFSDMIDGPVARKTGHESSFGAALDTAADFVFMAVCLWKWVPFLDLPYWMFFWILAIALVKIIHAGIGFAKGRTLFTVHSPLNRFTGVLLFVFPLTLGRLPVSYSAACVCAVATLAAAAEGAHIRKRMRTVTAK